MSSRAAMPQVSRAGRVAAARGATYASALRYGRGELAPVALPLRDVVRGAFFEHPAFLVRERAVPAGRRADDQGALRKFLAFRDQRARADEAIVTDLCVAQDRRADADQRE